ncbi:MAG: iron-containing alcohol dehydrogenase [Lachnospiraceae bacterium]|nr:iron-containing alcohol dehydrogenase [Lachnospiraceae bacterium]
MKRLVLSGKNIICGAGSLTALAELTCRRATVMTGGNSMLKNGVIDRAVQYLTEAGAQVQVLTGVRKNPSFEEVDGYLKDVREFRPDCMIAIGGGSAMDCAKAVVLFYEFSFLTKDNVLDYNATGKIPAMRKTALICIPSTSGTGSELTRGTVITDTQAKLKVPIMTDCLRPDIAILDPELTMTMPRQVVAETGLDALTHAIESYTNHNLDDFDEALASRAICGLMKWLPVSYREGSLIAREKVHHYQAMAGISFANVGLGMVHGIAHAFGAAFDLAHGLTNAIILPYALTYNRRDPVVEEKLQELSYLCRCEDIVEEIKRMRAELQIPNSYRDAGITEEAYLAQYDLLLEHSMLGATKVNPVVMTRESMGQMLHAVYYGDEIDF